MNQNPSTYKCPSGSFGADNEPPVTYDNSPDGTSGCWVDANPDRGLNSGAAVTAAKDRTVAQPLRESFMLTQAATYVRNILQVRLQDDYQPVSWTANDVDTICFTGPSPNGCVSGPDFPNGFFEETITHRTSGAFEYTKALSPFKVVVMRRYATKRAAFLSDIGWIAGAGLLASGAALVLLNPRPKQGDPSGLKLAPIVLASDGGLAVGGAW